MAEINQLDKLPKTKRNVAAWSSANKAEHIRLSHWPLESQVYASPNSKAGHVNCKSLPDFREVMKKYFHNVFMFCMNDEVVHTGYHKMAHYLFALACERKQ